MAVETVSAAKCFEGIQGVYRHDSRETGTAMTFSVYLPPRAKAGTKLPVVWYLSGLTCTHANVTEKGGFQRACAELGLVFVAPDTSPRGEGVPDDESYDLGQGAGLYVDATQPPFSDHYRMHSYIIEELPELISAEFPVDLDRQAIMGHSMGAGMARSPSRSGIRSVSAASPLSRRLSRRCRFPGARRYYRATSAPTVPYGAPMTQWH